jgi:signal transduction histidine kinase
MKDSARRAQSARAAVPENAATPEGFAAVVCPVTGVTISRSARWRDIPLTEEYWVTFELIEKNILSAFPYGRISPEGTIALFENYNQFLEAVNLGGRPYIEIADYSRIVNIPSRQTRVTVLNCLKDKVEDNLLIGHFVYNLPKHIRWMYNLGTKLKHPAIPMIACGTYQEAVQAASALLRASPRKRRLPLILRRFFDRLRPGYRLERYSDEILRFMGSINWDEEGSDFREVAASHPFKAVFDALTIVKTDIEQSFTEMRKAQSSLLEASRVAGMAEVATGVLHNVGNVLNSVNVSCTLLLDQLGRSRVGNVAKVAEMLDQAGADLARFVTEDPRGRQIPDYLASLAEALGEEHRLLSREAEALRGRIDHIKEIVAMQQSYGRVLGVSETIAPEQLMEDALKLYANSLAQHGISVRRAYAPTDPITVDKHAVLQILLNLINNAKNACAEAGNPGKCITLTLGGLGADRVCFQVGDNGVGITADNMTRIFQHGFTTRKSGHGYGLHSGAVAARQLGGRLSAHSDGPGAGATFTLELPCRPGENK